MRFFPCPPDRLANHRPARCNPLSILHLQNRSNIHRGTGARVDLVEALAAKSALEEATREALKAIILTGHKDNPRTEK
ncbi:MAG TPA: hypothetical protein P5572_17105 [Phycisphaerae bacterium]|nr:hypothetical protein [Phycisphaerales bacterium]HRX86746.1 hypothetical protein [Phycisphaerae bacterium]